MKDKYEISLWQDYIVPASDSVPEHYEEKKIALIGSDTLTTQSRAIFPKFVENINGTHTLTFKMYYTYIDTKTGKKVINPFLNLMVNERKIKVFWKDTWYDLVIKGIQENSSDKSITYTCKDLFINELSKTGFNLEFNNELQNNQGTVQELGEKVLEGTDWQLGSSQDTIQQTFEEPLYKAIVSNTFTSDQGEEIIAGKPIYVFYSTRQEKKLDCQFIYFPNESDYRTDINSQIFITDKNQSVTLSSWGEDGTAYLNSLVLFEIEDGQALSSYRGKRFVKQPKQVFNNLVERYCSVYDYNSESENVLGYEETEFKDPTYVFNLINNSKGFLNTNGWIGNDLTWKLYPDLSTVTTLGGFNSTSYLRGSGTLFNTALQNSSSYLPSGFQVGDKYIVRVRAFSNSNNVPSGTYIHTNFFTPKICNYTGEKSPGLINYFGTPTFTLNEDWLEYTFECIKSVTRQELITENIGFFLVCSDTCWIEEVQLFEEVFDDQNSRINPGELGKQSIATLKYKYFEKNQSVISKEDIKYLYVGTEPWSEATPVYNDNFEKIRSIEVKNSNRFNLLQNLAETFQCWVQFEIKHDETGKIVYYNDDDEYIGPQKFVYFKNSIGEKTGLGFIYGIDLKSTSRSINSDQITTKVIVLPNVNEFAEDGSCEISKSKENYPRENFILNFDYYISQGLIDGGQINKDLYLNTDDSIGYFYHLNQINSQYEANIKELKPKQNQLLKMEALLKTYSQYLTNAEEELTSIRSQIANLADVSIENFDTSTAIVNYIKNNPNNTRVISLYETYQQVKKDNVNYTSLKDEILDGIDALNGFIEELEETQEELLRQKKELDEQFYKKYSRFIQEGSWNSNEYLDDNLYYLDALGVSNTSSKPQISYNISVLRLSSLDKFKNKIFKIGDISFIQDTEFFGYTYINGVKTPYKEEVLVSEITSNFDDPSQDIIKIQNYKTRFEDLFQRITSTTQSLQYASGEYQRAANIVDNGGIINKETLQNSIQINQDLVYSAQNDAVINDNTGITVSDTTDPSKKTKLTSGGLFISTDGGLTWKNAVRGEGIATQYLTSGAINTGIITILDGSSPSFRWDANGINAYKKIYDLEGQSAGVNLGNFVRFDQFGLYGINGDETFIPVEEDDIWDTANFGLTWKGFFLKNRYGDGWIEISNTNDIRVMEDSDTERIKIGKLSSSTDDNDTISYVYGIRISDAAGIPVMETADDGNLWLRQALNISSTDGDYNISVGYLDGTKSVLGAEIHEVFNANDNFIVYEDGSIIATNGNFTGEIHATSGSIGNLSISQVEQSAFKVTIDSSNGTIFKNGEGTKTLTARLYEGGTEVTSGLTYAWYKGTSTEVFARTKAITVSADSTDAIYIYRCIVTKS